MWKIAKHDGRDLAFAIDCWFASAITIDEFKLWLDEVIRSMPLEDIPGYIVSPNKKYTALSRLAVLLVLSAARCLVSFLF